MKVVLYSTGCPQCKVLKEKLDAAGIEYETVEDQEIMEEKGFMTAPMLEKDDTVMNFVEAVNWLRADNPSELCSSCNI